MRKISQILVASIALTTSLGLEACKSDADTGNTGGEGGESPSSGGKGNAHSGGKGSSTTGGKGNTKSGGASGVSGGQGGDLGGQGGDKPTSGGSDVGSGGSETGTGGGGNEVVPCEGEDCTVALDACLDAEGPGEAMLMSGRGAFSASQTWMDGWTNWSADSSPGTTDADADETLEGDITADKTLTADKVWGLRGYVHVVGATLTIEPGTVIKGEPGASVLLISRTGKIHAVGTQEKPIIFTSSAKNGEKASGEWGGVILLGQASNWQGGDVAIEGIGSPGGNDKYGPGGADGTVTTWDDESSGEMKYVRIEFGGIELSAGKEVNGLTLGAVGSGTSVSYIQVNNTLDDCFEWFGGTVNTNHIVCNNDGDDMFDADQGLRGTIDTAFGRKGPISKASSDPNGLEWDSDLGGKLPVSNVHIKNATLCGFGEEVGQTNPSYGMVLREGITGSLDNVFVGGFEFFADARDAFGANADPGVTLKDVVSVGMIGGVVSPPETKNFPDDYADSAACKIAIDCDDDAGFDENAWFADADGSLLVE